jgi:hypothetical protein
MRFNIDEYVTVHERVEKFYAKYPEGRITTTILEHNAETGFILMRADVYRESDDAQPAATGHAYEMRSAGHVQQGSYVEVCETSSVGRALALLGFEVKRGIASREEMRKAARVPPPEKPAPPAPPKPAPAQAKPAPPQAKVAPAQETKTEPRPAADPSLVAEENPLLDEEIVHSAQELGYDEAKVRRWVNQKFGVTGGLESLTDHDKREVLKLFREQAQAAQAKSATK